MLTRENDLYVVFRIVDEVEPEIIIDVDMTLARAGMVSRGLMNESIPANVKIYSVETGKLQDELEKKAMEFPIYNSIYNGKLSVETRPSQEDRSLLIAMRTIPDEADVADIRPRFVLTDDASWIINIFGDDYEVTDIDIEGDKYFFANRLINI